MLCKSARIRDIDGLRDKTLGLTYICNLAAVEYILSTLASVGEQSRAAGQLDK